MNILKAVYCNQYYELKPKGKEATARTNGTRLLIVSTALNVIFLVVLMMVISEDFADALVDTIEDVFGRRQSRTIGKVVTLIPFLIAFPLIRYTLGREEIYNNLIDEFESLPEIEQKRVSQKGLYYFMASLGGFGLAFALAIIFLV